MLLGLFLTGIGMLCGAVLVGALDPERRLNRVEALCVALTIGLTLSLVGILVLSIISGAITVAVFLFAAAACTVFLVYRSEVRAYFDGIAWGGAFGIPVIAFLIAFGIVYGLVFAQVLHAQNGILASNIISWGDTLYHLSVIEPLATQRHFTLFEPNIAFLPLNYPLLIDFMSVVLRHGGTGVLTSFHLPAVVSAALLVLLLYLFALRLLKQKTLAVVALLVILVGGGFGFLYFFGDLYHALQTSGVSGVVQTVQNHPYWYTHLDDYTGGKSANTAAPFNIAWITPIISFFTHQRSFILGFALFLAILIGILVYWDRPAVSARWIAIAGLLPLVHFQGTFIALALALGVWFLTNTGFQKPWFVGALIVGALSAAQLFFIERFTEVVAASHSFLRLGFGWLFCSHAQNWLACDSGVAGRDANFFWFLLKNFGIVAIGWAFGLLVLLRARAHQNAAERSITAAMLTASAVLFIVPNLVVFQPWEFDNNKVIFYWWFFAVLVALLAIRALRRRPVAVFCTAAFLVLGAFSGALDVYQRIAFGWQDGGTYADTADREIVSWITTHTQPSDVILGDDLRSEFIPALAGRPLYLGYRGWLISHGVEAETQARDSRIQRGDVCGAVTYVFTNPGTSITLASPVARGTVAYCAPSDPQKCLITPACPL